MSLSLSIMFAFINLLLILVSTVPSLPWTPKAKTSFPGSGALPSSLHPLDRAPFWESSIPASERVFLHSPHPAKELPLAQNWHGSCLLYLCPTPLQPGLEHVQTALSAILKKRSVRSSPPPTELGSLEPSLNSDSPCWFLKGKHEEEARRLRKGLGQRGRCSTPRPANRAVRIFGQ